MVVDLDQYLPVSRKRGNPDFATDMSEFECVLQKVRQCRLQCHAVGVDVQERVYFMHREVASCGVRIESRGAFRIGDEGRDGKYAPIAAPSHPHLVDGLLDQHAQRTQTALQHRAGCTAHVHVAQLQRADGEGGSRYGVAEFVYQESDPLACLIVVTLEYFDITLRAKRQDSIGNRIVNAAIQCAELVECDGHGELERHIRDGLTEVAVIVNDLVDCVAQRQQITSVGAGACSDFRQRELVAARGARDKDALRLPPGIFRFEGSYQLLQNHRNAVCELSLRCRPARPRRSFHHAPLYEFGTVVVEKGVHQRVKLISHGL